MLLKKGDEYMREIVKNWVSKNEITTPLQGTPAHRSSGIIKAIMKDGKKVAVGRIDYEEMDKDIANEILYEQLIGIIDQYVEPLKNNEIILMECNEKYKNAYKLTNAAKVKQHLEVIEEIANEIDSSNKEQS